MKKSFLIFITILLSSQIFAQGAEEKAKGFQKDKLFIGGNFGLSFGDYTLINVSPQLGYRFTPHFAAGAGINGQYISIKQRDVSGNLYSKVTQGVAGLNIFGRVYPIRNIMLQVQPEANYVFGKQTFYQPAETYHIPSVLAPSLLAGGGIVLPAGRGALIISAMYDVLQNPNAPYGKQAIINFGYSVGL